MRKIFIVCLLGFIACTNSTAQIDAGLFRFPDVSQSQIVFTYANDVWIVGKEGGMANKLSSPAGVESFPKFSPDGKTIAFTGNYDGNDDVYAMPASGWRACTCNATWFTRPCSRLDTRMANGILFASGRESERARYNQFFTIASTGGPAEKLPTGLCRVWFLFTGWKTNGIDFSQHGFQNLETIPGRFECRYPYFQFEGSEF
jgi:tricorn protease